MTNQQPLPPCCFCNSVHYPDIKCDQNAMKKFKEKLREEMFRIAVKPDSNIDSENDLFTEEDYEK